MIYRLELNVLNVPYVTEIKGQSIYCISLNIILTLQGNTCSYIF